MSRRRVVRIINLESPGGLACLRRVAVGAQIGPAAVGLGLGGEERRWVADVNGGTVLAVQHPGAGAAAGRRVPATGSGAQVVVAAGRIGEQGIAGEVAGPC